MAPPTGKLRLIRRIRTIRRRQLGPMLDGLAREIAVWWTRPARRPVARELRRLVTAVEGSVTAAGRIAAAEERLNRSLEELSHKRRAADRDVTARWGPRPPVVPGSLAVGVTLAIAALALVAGNSLLLDRYLLPPAFQTGPLRSVVVPGPWVAIPFSTLALVLGVFHFALFTTGRTVGLRVLGVFAVLLLLAQGGLQAAATVVAVQMWAGLALGTWAGIGALILLAGAVGLLPPVIGATAHGAMDRFARWSAAREQRSMGRSGEAGERLVHRLERSLQQLSSGMASLRAEAAAVPEGDVARLLIRAEPTPSVERLAAVLDRLALTVDRGQAGQPAGAGQSALRYLVDLGAGAVWLLAAGAALVLARPAGGALADAAADVVTTAPGLPGLPGAGLTAVLAAFLLGGLFVRLASDRIGRRPDPRITGAAIVLFGVSTASLAMALASTVAGTAPLGLDVLSMAAVLNVLILTAGIAAARLPEAVRAVASAIRLVIDLLAWTVLRVSDLALATADLALTGKIPRARAPRRAPTRAATGDVRVHAAALGAGPDGR
jgi:MFS family permease